MAEFWVIVKLQNIECLLRLFRLAQRMNTQHHFPPIWPVEGKKITIRNIIASKTRKQNHILIAFPQNYIHNDQKKVASPCWQTVHCSHHPLIGNHKPSTLVFHVLAFWQLDGGHVGPRVCRCLSATDYTLAWVWAEEEHTVLTFLSVNSSTHKEQIQGSTVIQ